MSNVKPHIGIFKRSKFVTHNEPAAWYVRIMTPHGYRQFSCKDQNDAMRLAHAFHEVIWNA